VYFLFFSNKSSKRSTDSFPKAIRSEKTVVNLGVGISTCPGNFIPSKPVTEIYSGIFMLYFFKQE